MSMRPFQGKCPTCGHDHGYDNKEFEKIMSKYKTDEEPHPRTVGLKEPFCILPETADRVDALHAQIAAILDQEKRDFDEAHPDFSSMWRDIVHASIDFYRKDPQQRALMLSELERFSPTGRLRR